MLHSRHYQLVDFLAERGELGLVVEVAVLDAGETVAHTRAYNHRSHLQDDIHGITPGGLREFHIRFTHSRRIVYACYLALHTDPEVAGKRVALAKAVLLAGAIEVLRQRPYHQRGRLRVLVGIRNQLAVEDLRGIRSMMLALAADGGQFRVGDYVAGCKRQREAQAEADRQKQRAQGGNSIKHGVLTSNRLRATAAADAELSNRNRNHNRTLTTHCLLGVVEVVDLRSVGLRDQDAAKQLAFLLTGLTGRDVLIEQVHAVDRNALGLQHDRGLELAGEDGITLIVAAVNTHHHHILVRSRLQRCNRPERDRTVTRNDALDVRMLLQDGVH